MGCTPSEKMANRLRTQMQQSQTKYHVLTWYTSVFNAKVNVTIYMRMEPASKNLMQCTNTQSFNQWVTSPLRRRNGNHRDASGSPGKSIDGIGECKRAIENMPGVDIVYARWIGKRYSNERKDKEAIRDRLSSRNGISDEWQKFQLRTNSDCQWHIAEAVAIGTAILLYSCLSWMLHFDVKRYLIHWSSNIKSYTITAFAASLGELCRTGRYGLILVLLTFAWTNSLTV